MNILKATNQFEKWLGQHTDLVKRDLRLKHRRMAESPFCFLRATFYRWMQIWPQLCPNLNKAPKVLAVGDLHIENFGTWRDAEGRLIWGVNDFDEAAALPYTLDLVRLAASALLATAQGHIGIKAKEICAAILEGYRQSILGGGLPFVLAENNLWLRDIAFVESRDPVHFWQGMADLPPTRDELPRSAQHALEHLMPAPGLPYEVRTRIAGMGSLGHMRFVAIAEFDGGQIAREAKALAPSAAFWAGESKGRGDINYQTILRQAVRCPDPFVQQHGRWIVRRLAPYCSRIELTSVPRQRDEWRPLSAMGWETANIHLGSRSAQKRLRAHFKKLKPGWLLSASKDMVDAVSADWRAWRKAAGV
jgi:hypothetical protein